MPLEDLAAAGEGQAAVDYFQRAAERARAVFAHKTALACYDRLLELLSDPTDWPTYFDVLNQRAEVWGWIGDREAQGKDLEEMLSLAQTVSDDHRLAFALHRRSEWHRMQGHYEAADKDAYAA